MAFADQLAGEMRKHGNLMEDYYGKLKATVEHDSPKDAAIMALLKKIDEAQSWYKKAEVMVTKRVSNSFHHNSTNIIPLVRHPTSLIWKSIYISI